jgi:hypothetical protein
MTDDRIDLMVGWSLVIGHAPLVAAHGSPVTLL